MISVIVPVYNVERYLEATLDSILDSSYKDLELILIDDGSSDGSGGICDRYAQSHQRIRVIHQANAGVSAARNAGLALATGDYISFVDADDIVHPRMFSILLSAIENGDYDMSMALMRMVPSNDCSQLISKDGNRNVPLPRRQVITKSDYLRKLYSVGSISILYQGCWCKLFKSDLVKGIMFVRSGSEDTVWNNLMALKMKQGVLVEQELYFYVNRPSSASHQGVTPRFVDIMNSYKLCLDDIPAEHKIYRSWCLEKLYKTMLSTTFRAHGSELSQVALSTNKRLYKETIKEYLSSEMAWTKKYGLLLFYRVPWLYRLFMGCSELVARLRG